MQIHYVSRVILYFKNTQNKHVNWFFSLHFFFLIRGAPFMFMIKREIGENIAYDPFMHIWFKCV